MKTKNLSFLLFALLFALAVGCSESGSEGRTILRVNDCIVTEDAFIEEIDNMRLCWDVCATMPEEGSRSPQEAGALILEDELKTRVLSEKLIPLAAVKNHYKDMIPGLLARAEEIRKEIAPDGSNFAKMARKYSKDSNAPTGGRLGSFTRTGMVYPVASLAFEGKPGDIVGPFLSLVGCHIVLVEGKVEGVVPASDRVKASHILLPYEEDNPAFLTARVPEILAEMQASSAMKVLLPEYKAFVKIGEQKK